MAGNPFRTTRAAAARAVRAGLLPYARDLVENGLAMARSEREACGHIARLSTLAVRMGHIEEAGRQALSGLSLAERLGHGRLQSQFRLDLAEAALLGTDSESAREQLVLVGSVRDPTLARRTAELRTYVAVTGTRPNWLFDDSPQPRGALGRIRTTLDLADPRRSVQTLRRVLGEVVGDPKPLLALQFAHLCGAAATCAELSGRAAAGESLDRLAYVGFRLFRLEAERPPGDPPVVAKGAEGAMDPDEPVWDQIAHWARLYFHLLWKDPSAYFHSIRVARYASCFCRLLGGGKIQQRYAAMAGLLHDIGALSLLYDSAHRLLMVPRRHVYQGAVAARIATRLGLPAAVVESLARLPNLLQPIRFSREHLETASPVARAVAVAHAYDELTANANGHGFVRHLSAVYELSRLFGLPEPHVNAIRLATAEVLQGRSRQARANPPPPSAKRAPVGLRAASLLGSAPDGRPVQPPDARRAPHEPAGARTPAGAWVRRLAALPLTPLLATLDRGGLRILFQPILDLRTGAIHGYEALARGPEASSIADAERLFSAAERAGVRGWLVDLCLQRALELATTLLDPGTRLFVNADLHGLDRLARPDGPLASALASTGVAPSQVVIEVSERHPLAHPQQTGELRQALRRSGCSLAMDDFGTAYSCYQQLLALEPDYIKVDLSLIRSVDRDRRRCALIAGLALYCREFGVHLVAEGIETQEELRVLCDLGVDYGQGHFLAPPAEIPPSALGQAQAALRQLGTLSRPAT